MDVGTNSTGGDDGQFPGYTAGRTRIRLFWSLGCDWLAAWYRHPKGVLGLTRVWGLPAMAVATLRSFTFGTVASPRDWRADNPVSGFEKQC